MEKEIESTEIKNEVVNEKQNEEKIEETSTEYQSEEVEETETEFSEGTEKKTEDETKNTNVEEEKRRNAEFAQRRREKERREQEQRAIARKAELNGIKKALKGVNPYTNEALETDEDVEYYLIQVEMEEKNLDPNSFADFRKFKKLQVEKSQPMSEEEWVAKDSKDFYNKYPDAPTFDDIFKDTDFLEYAEKYHKGELGKTTPLAKIYGNYQTYKQDRANFDKLVEKKANELFEKRMAKLKSSPGGVEGKTSEENTFYSREQIEKMSIEEIRKNMAKVDASLAYLRKEK